MQAMGSCLTNKYAEGYPGARYYGGCQIVDQTEQLAIDRACQLFGAEFANVQPHSGAQANAAVFFACMKPGDTFLGLDLAHGGHLSHGSPVNLSGINYHPVAYHVKEETGMVDYDEMEQLALEHKPKLIVSGASAYSRDWDYKRMRKIAESRCFVNVRYVSPCRFDCQRFIEQPDGILSHRDHNHPQNPSRTSWWYDPSSERFPESLGIKNSEGRNQDDVTSN